MDRKKITYQLFIAWPSYHLAISRHDSVGLPVALLEVSGQIPDAVEDLKKILHAFGSVVNLI